MMTFPSAPPASPTAPVAHKFVWPRWAPKVDPSRSESNSQLTDFSQISLPVPDVTHILGHILYLGFLLWHLWMTRPLRTCVNTYVYVCTKLTHALSRKVLSLTKPKGKIYKTKSPGHYITNPTHVPFWKLFKMIICKY